MKSFFTFIFLGLSVLQIQSQTLQSVESVEYDPIHNRFLVSNSNSIIARNSDGTFSFFGSSSATHGMEVMDEHLFAIDGKMIRGFNLNSETQVMGTSILSATFLNGMTNDGEGNLYLTDFVGRKIYKIDVSNLSNPQVEVLVNNTVSTPNGIVYDGENNRLIFVNWGSNAAIKMVDLSDNSVSTLATTTFGNMDGIDDDNEGNYYISTWSPNQIIKYDANFANPPEVVMTPLINQAADICYARQIDTLAIPHSTNMLTFVGFETTSTKDIFAEDFELTIYPNPVSAESVVAFELKEKTTMNLSIYDVQGQLLQTLVQGEKMAGKYLVSFEGLDLANGVYFCTLQAEGLVKTVEMIVGDN